MDEYLYRFTDDLRSYLSDHNDEDSHYTVYGIRLEKFLVLKYTPCGVWISMGTYFINDTSYDQDHHKKFVNLKCRKHYADKTKDEALTSYITRKNKQIIILNTKLQNAKRMLEIAKTINPNEKINNTSDKNYWN